MAFLRSTASRRSFLMATATCALTAVPPAYAQSDWPARPVKIVVPFPAGGSTDAVGRLLANELGKQLGQPVIVDNKGGANGNIGSDNVAKAPADGYTLLLSGIGSNAINYTLYRRMAYSNASFTHIALLATGPGVLVVNPAFPAQTFQDFVRIVRAEPGKYSYASAGSGSSGHLAMELLKQTLGLDIVHVPYKGGAPAITDVIAGQVPAMVLNNDVLLPHVRSGKLRALGVASPARNAAYPGVPTIAESGVPGFEAVSWFGLSAPAGTPAPIIERLSAATRQALQTPAMRHYLESTGFVVAGGTSAEFSRFVQAEITKWKTVVERSGASAD